jgi:NAD(P)-dependent dehydrogenase (short-subunit alcohol dehydrogenase family)
MGGPTGLALKSVARVFITGSADGLGLELGRELADDGHEVVLHGRSPERAAQARAQVPEAIDALAGDLARTTQSRALAEQALALGPYDAVVHNAGLGFRERQAVTEDGIEHVFAVNVLAPYVLTALLPARRLIYLSSGLHQRGNPDLDDLAWENRPWNPMQAYSDSKLLDVALALAVAARWPDLVATAVEPGWIATKMGGAGAPGTLAEGVDTQRWLAVSDDPDAQRSGELFSQRRTEQPHLLATDTDFQARLISACERVSGVSLPSSSGLA